MVAAFTVLVQELRYALNPSRLLSVPPVVRNTPGNLM
jgi:hypothetical protein